MDPVSANNAKNRQVHGALSLRVDDLLTTGDDVGQRIQWKHEDKHGWYINVHQNVALDELQEITFDKCLKDDTPLTPQMPQKCSRSDQLVTIADTIPHWLPILQAHPRQHRRPLRTFAPSIKQSEPSWEDLVIQMHPFATMKISHPNAHMLCFLQRNKIPDEEHRTREVHWLITRRISSPLQPCPQLLQNCTDSCVVTA